MSIQFTPDTPATRRAFNRLAREKMKLRLLADIRMDLMVCELEGYSKLEYLDELLALVQELRKGRWGKMMDKEKGPAVQGRKALTIPKRSDGMPDYNAVTEFAKLNSITTLKDLEKLGSPISGDEYVLMTKLRYRLKKSIIP